MWLLTIKPSFLNEMLALPAKELAQINKKLQLLTDDPTPDAKVKKQLKHLDGKLHRLRAGDFRVFYTFDATHVSVLALRRRDETTYDDDVEPELLGGSVPELGRDPWNAWLASPKSQAAMLPRPITVELLEGLAIAKEHHDALLAIRTEDELLACDRVPGPVLEKVIDGLVGRPIDQVEKQPDLIVENTEDLLRYREGQLVAFLLKLDPEQEKFVGWALSAKGPTLLKGGPGTGKSTVALYRVRAMIEALRKAGVARPRVLFTTYTNALIRFSEQLLRALLGDDAALVEVRTADSVAVGIARLAGLEPHFADGPEVRRAMERAVRDVRFDGNALAQAAQKRTLDRLGLDYLTEEVLGVIEARRLESPVEYRSAPRPGRRYALNETQRQAVWCVRDSFGHALADSGRHTWEQVRALAARYLAGGGAAERYDAVVVDEAQDLSPTALEVLVRLCKEPNRLFLTADANQSIYGGSFRWTDVHDSLRFQGRTGVLRANHRSTHEIGEAAQSYLAAGAIDDEPVERGYAHSGPLPAVRAVSGREDEARLIARFFRSATRELRLGPGSCAVLCATNAGAQRLATALSEEGLKAVYMPPKELDLAAPVVKCLTLKSAKGLEFPVVAIAGFMDGSYPMIPAASTDEARGEIVARERRTLFVAMTRAMRALLLVVPSDGHGELLAGFDRDLWNLGTVSP